MTPNIPDDINQIQEAILDRFAPLPNFRVVVRGICEIPEAQWRQLTGEERRERWSGSSDYPDISHWQNYRWLNPLTGDTLSFHEVDCLARSGTGWTFEPTSPYTATLHIHYGDITILELEARKPIDWESMRRPSDFRSIISDEQRERLKGAMLSRNRINNTACYYYNDDPRLRCAVNPTGKCEGCGDFTPA